MGYSQSKKTIERVRPILDLVVERNDTLKFPSKDTRKLCYAIRDALAVIKQLHNQWQIYQAEVQTPLKTEWTSQYNKYLTIPDKFKIKIKEGHVVFEPRERLDYSDPIIELAASKVDEMDFGEAITLLEIVGICAQHKLKRMIFPKASLLNNDLDRLSRWAALNGYTLADTAPLTLLKKDGNSTQNGNTNEG